MKKLFLLLLLTTISTYPMNDMELDGDPQNTPQPVWKQIRWRVVPANKFSLADRVKSMNSIIHTLSGIACRLEMLPCVSVQKTVVAEKLRTFICDGITKRDNIIANHLDPDDDEFEDLSVHLKQIADQFLSTYHDAEAHLRTSIENLERMGREHNSDGMNDLLEKLASLSL